MDNGRDDLAVRRKITARGPDHAFQVQPALFNGAAHVFPGVGRIAREVHVVGRQRQIRRGWRNKHVERAGQPHRRAVKLRAEGEPGRGSRLCGQAGGGNLKPLHGHGHRRSKALIAEQEPSVPHNGFCHVQTAEPVRLRPPLARVRRFRSGGCRRFFAQGGEQGEAAVSVHNQRQIGTIQNQFSGFQHGLARSGRSCPGCGVAQARGAETPETKQTPVCRAVVHDDIAQGQIPVNANVRPAPVPSALVSAGRLVPDVGASLQRQPDIPVGPAGKRGVGPRPHKAVQRVQGQTGRPDPGVQLQGSGAHVPGDVERIVPRAPRVQSEGDRLGGIKCQRGGAQGKIRHQGRRLCRARGRDTEKTPLFRRETAHANPPASGFGRQIRNRACCGFPASPGGGKGKARPVRPEEQPGMGGGEFQRVQGKRACRRIERQSPEAAGVHAQGGVFPRASAEGKRAQRGFPGFRPPGGGHASAAVLHLDVPLKIQPAVHVAEGRSAQCGAQNRQGKITRQQRGAKRRRVDRAFAFQSQHSLVVDPEGKTHGRARAGARRILGNPAVHPGDADAARSGKRGVFPYERRVTQDKVRPFHNKSRSRP